MADLRQTVTILIVIMLMMSFLGNWRTHEKPQERLYQNSTELYHKIYRGKWEASESFGPMSEKSGLVYFEAEQRSNDKFTAGFFLFNGVWQDDQLFTFLSFNCTFDTLTRQLSVVEGLEIYSNRLFLESLQAQGNLTFTPSQDIFEAEGWLSQSNRTIEFELFQLTEEDMKAGKVSYSAFYTLINLLIIFAFMRHLRFCLESESYAKQTSLLFLGMNSCIDLFLSLWHLRLALFDFSICFDYMILASVWSFAVYVIVQSRLVRVVWKAQNQSIADFGSVFERSQYGVFSTRFFVSVFFFVLVSVASQDWYLVTIAVLHSFFFPQAIKNIIHNYKGALRPSVYLSLGVGRTALILYIFGYPENFLVWRPKLWFAIGVTVVMAVQMLILAVQGWCGARFMVPHQLKPHVYNYYRPFSDELELTELTDCNICLLSIDKSDRNIMTTPCSHRFHKECLSQWMLIKLQCPTCRTELPALEE